ncbi:MAG: sulfatase-like hydrolase/transferase [Verrucomicrobiota bacterium JB024]|nr:sulfatase-like hydrolase/transferase [Verrucomicrobiota bacterium JB024]
MKPIKILLAAFVLCGPILARAQSQSDYERTVQSPPDDGGGPSLYFSTASGAPTAGHMMSTGADAMKAYGLARLKEPGYFGGSDEAYRIDSSEFTGGVLVSGSATTEYLAGGAGAVSLIFKTPASLDEYQSLISRGYYNNSGLGYLEIRIRGGALAVGYNGNQVEKIGRLKPDTWYYVALTYDLGSKGLKWYLGEAGSETLNTGSLVLDGAGDATKAIGIGGRINDARFEGAMENVAIWNRALLPQAIEAQFAALGGKSSEPDLSSAPPADAPPAAPARAVAYAASGNPAKKLPSEKPSIVLIVADDLGYGDLGSYGDTGFVPTPNIDQLARTGVRFTDAYVTAPVCGPSRYGFMTGRYQQRLGIVDNRDCYAEIPPPDNRIPEGCDVINQPLEREGYVTAMIGKWNLPGYPKTTFKETYSVMHFGADYWPDDSGHYVGVNEPRAVNSSKEPPFWGPKREGDEYLTDRLGRQAVEFIDKHAKEPFFLYLAFNAPHSPLEAKASYRDAVAHLPSEALRFYGAMVLSLDENVGRVLQALQRNGIAENTLVVFTSDNGPTFAFNVGWPEDWPKELLGSTGPLRGRKAQLLEGGIRVPLLISWPDYLPAGATYTEPVSTLDFFPTFCAAVGLPTAHDLDGVNLLPYLSGSASGAPHERLFWQIGAHAAIREGDWKLRTYKGEPVLHNLAEDIGETRDVYKDYPEVAGPMMEKLTAFQAQLPEKVNP